MARYKDGWHKLDGTLLNYFVEDGFITHGFKSDNPNKKIYPYKFNKEKKKWTKAEPIAYIGVLATIGWR